MKITNMRPDRRIRLWAETGSRLIDQDGNEVRAASAGLGTSQTIWWSENTLAEGTPLRASLVFEQVPTAATEAALLELTFSEARAPFKISFRNVAITRD
jgi:hypothetical protein